MREYIYVYTYSVGTKGVINMQLLPSYAVTHGIVEQFLAIYY